jgi:hypothetical protein
MDRAGGAPAANAYTAFANEEGRLDARRVQHAVKKALSARTAALAATVLAAVVGLCRAEAPNDDGRYLLEVRGAELLIAPPAAGKPPAPAAAEGDADAADAAGANTSLIVLERSAGEWAMTLAGRFGQGQGQVLARGFVASAQRRGTSWRITAELLLGGLTRKRDWLDKDLPSLGSAELAFEARDGALSGTWKMTAADKSASGVIGGRVEALRAWPLPAPPRPGEHPRFLLRKGDLPGLKAKAQTPWGEAMLKRLEEPGWSRSGMAVAQGLLYQISGQRRHADKARELFDADIRSGWWKAIGPIHDPAHKATEAMFAYDLIHDTCGAAFHARMRDFLGDKVRHLWDFAEINSGNGHPHSNWSAQYNSSAGMVALMLLADPVAGLPAAPGEWDFPKVSPPAEFKVVDGMPVLSIDDAPLRKWLFSGPLNIGLEQDGLESLGGAAKAWPTAGTTFRTKAKANPREDSVSGKFPQAIQFKNAKPRPRNISVLGDDLQPLTKEVTATFGAVPETAVIGANEYIERGFGAPGMVHAWRAAGLRSFQTLYFFAVIDNPAPRHVQVRLTGSKGDWYYHNSGLYISGRWFEHGDVLWLDKGRHPATRRLTVGQLCEAHGRHHLYDDVWLRPLDEAGVRNAPAVRDTEARFRRKYLASLATRHDSLGRPDPEALLWLPLTRLYMSLYARNAIGDGGWHSAGQCYTQHPMRVAMPVAHAWRNATGTEVTGEQHLGWFLGQAAMRTVFGERWARMQDYGRGGGPVGVDLFARGLASVPPEVRPAVLWAQQRTADLTDRKLFDAPEGAVDELDPMSAAFALVNMPAGAAGGAPGANPSASLPRAVVDGQRLGYTMRNRWRDGNDIVALFTGFRHPGGDWPCEGAALDLRLMGLGGEWAVRGNGHIGEETSTVAVAGASAPTDVRQRRLATAEDGSAVVSLAYALGKNGTGMRSLAVDYSGASGAPALLALVDRVKYRPAAAAAAKVQPGAGPKLPASAEEGLDELAGKPSTATAVAAPNRWRLVTHVDNKVTAVEGGFAISAPGGAMLKGLVVAPRKARCSARDVPHSIEVNYRYDHKIGQFTRRVIELPGDDFFFVVMTMGAGETPAMTATGAGPDAVVEVGRQSVRFDGEKVVLGQFGKGGGR